MQAKLWLTRAVVLLCSVSLTGCVLPVVPNYDRVALAQKGKLSEALTVEQVRNIAGGWADELDAAVRSRHLQDIYAREVLFYGTLLFSAGALQVARQASDGWRRARNTGAGMAAGADLFRGHYEPENQSLAFARAAALMKCMNAALEPIPGELEYTQLLDSDEKAAISAKLTAAPADLDALYNDVPKLTLHFMEQVVLPRLQADLKAISLGTPTKQELTAVLDKYRADKASGDAAGAAAFLSSGTKSAMKAFLNNQAVPDEVIKLRQKAVVSALASYASELLLCKPTT